MRCLNQFYSQANTFSYVTWKLQLAKTEHCHKVPTFPFHFTHLYGGKKERVCMVPNPSMRWSRCIYEHETIEQNANLLIKIESRKFRIYFKWKRRGKIRHGSPPHFNCLEIMLRLINSRSNWITLPSLS